MLSLVFIYLQKGLVPLISVNGLHQLHILVFILAAFHVFYSAITMALGRAKIRGWKNWEEETKSEQYAYTNGMNINFMEIFEMR